MTLDERTALVALAFIVASAIAACGLLGVLS